MSKNKCLCICLLLTVTLCAGCGEHQLSAIDPSVDYVFSDVSDNTHVIEENKTVTFMECISPDVMPTSIGDTDSFVGGYNGIYIQTIDSDLIDYAHVHVKCPSMTVEDVNIIMMDENNAWRYITQGMLDAYPTQPFGEIKDTISAIANSNTTNITVDVWYWEDPNDDTNFNKVSKQKTFTVNTNIANIFEHIFQDIYNDPTQPIINISDTAMGTWVVRGKMHNDSRTTSSHAFGCAIDINPSTGSYNIGGSWYGNGYGQDVMTKTMWEQLPESHQKYHVLYDESPIVQIFKRYGFYWGGDWSGTKDNMHLAFIGDGSGREVGIKNYQEGLGD